MSIITGYPSQEKEDRSVVEPATVNSVDPFRYALEILSHCFVRLVGSDAVEAGSTSKVLVATAHSALVGDTIRFTSGTFSGYEVVVASKTTNAITLAQQLSAAPSAADTFNILRHTKPLVTEDGGVQIVPSVHSSINNGSKAVATSGTAETLVASTTACKKVDIMALDTNTGKVWIGGSTIDKTAKNGKYLFAAQSYTIEIDDLVKIYLDVDTNGEGVVFTYYN